jgi:hypothetical protein
MCWRCVQIVNKQGELSIYIRSSTATRAILLHLHPALRNRGQTTIHALLQCMQDEEYRLVLNASLWETIREALDYTVQVAQQCFCYV